MSTLWFSLNNNLQQTPSQENEPLHSLKTAEKMELATKRIRLNCQETTAHHKGEDSQLTTTMEGTQLTVTSAATTNISQINKIL